MRVIIVGSGLSGIITGHCLLKAGIDDFVILERRPDPVERSGSCIAFYPQTFRIFDQLGLLSDVKKLSQPLHHWIHLDPQGRTIYDGEFCELLETNHGHPAMPFMRRDLMGIFYSKLPNRERYIVPNKKVSGIEQDDTSVTVTCADGSVFQGDVLIGCDGVHSIVRRLVFEQPDQQQTRPGSEYRGLFGSCPRPEGISPCNITETHDRDIVFMILCTDDTAFWLITDRKDKLDSRRYTSEDVQTLVDKFRDHSVAPGGKVTFGDLWEARDKVPGPGMYDYMEGIAEQWHKGRVVIVGDAAHRMTPNLGLGGNIAIEDVASLMNQLNVVVKAHPKPTTEQLQEAFSRHQKDRQAVVKFLAGLTGGYTRWTSWKNWLGWFIQAWLWPMLGDGFIVNWNLSPMIKDSVKLNFVGEENLPVGMVKWKYA